MRRITLLAATGLLLSPVLVLMGWLLADPSAWEAAYGQPERLLRLLGNSLVVSGVTVLVSVGLGLILGLVLFRTDLPGRRGFVLVCVALAALPLYVSAGAWIAWLGLGSLLERAVAAGWIQGVAYTPLTTLFLGLHFSLSDRGQEDAARLEGGWQAMVWRILLPANRGAIGLAAVCVALLSLTDITVTDILRVRTYSEEVFTQFQRGMGPERAMAIAFPLFGVTAVLVAAAMPLLRREWAGLSDTLEWNASRFRLGRWRWPAVAGVAGVGLLLWGVPVVYLFRAIQHPAQFVQALQAAGDDVVGSLITTPVVGILAAALAFPFALALLGGSRLARLPVIVLFAVPAPVLGHGLIALFNRPGWPAAVYDSAFMLVLAGMLRAFPFAVLIEFPALLRIPRSFEEIARLEGASVWQRLRAVWIPCAGRACGLAALVGFLLALGELGASFLVAPPGQATLALHFFSQIHFGLYPDAASICVVLLLTASICALGGYWVVARRHSG